MATTTERAGAAWTARATAVIPGGVTSFTRGLNPPITWFGWTVPTLVQLGIVVVAGLVLLGVSILEFDRGD